MSPSEYILRKSIVASSLSSGEWQSLPVAIKDRAFFSSHVESVRFLDAARSRIADLLDNARLSNNAPTTSRAQVVSDIMRAARDAGISSGSGSLSDPGSEARANVIIDTNAGLAAGYSKALISNSLGALLAFPAQELLRIEQRNVPRDWLARWRQAGGRLFNGRMIALKDDPIWLKISRFSLPYPPFDFNSGMGVEDVSRDDAISIGLIQPDYTPPPSSPIDDFNNSLQADLSASSPDSPALKALKDVFGDQVQFNHHTKKINFDGAFIQGAVNKIAADVDSGAKSTSVKIKPSVGIPSPLFRSKASLPDSFISPLHLSPSNLFHVIKDHVGSDKDPNNNIPLSLRELDLIGHVWRTPESVSKGDDDSYWILSATAADGNLYRLVVSIEKTPVSLSIPSTKKRQKNSRVYNPEQFCLAANFLSRHSQPDTAYYTIFHSPSITTHPQ